MAASSKSRWFYLAMIVIGVAAVLYADVRKAGRNEKIVPTADQLKAAFPDSTRMTEQQEPFHHWLVFTTGGQPAGAVFMTTDVPPDVKGYTGRVPALVGMDRKGDVVRVILLENRETPYYMRLIQRSDFLKRMAGRSVKDNWEKVDTVSGATITSKAIVKDVSMASKIMASRLFGITIPQREAGGREFLTLILLIIPLALGLVSRFLRRNKPLKWVSLVAGIVFVGVHLDIPLSFSHITAVLSGDLPPWSNERLVVLLLYAGITTVFLGPAFCGHVCPFGAMQDLAYRASPWRLRVSGTLLSRLGKIRWVILFVLVLLAFPGGIHEAAGFEPYPYLFDELHRLALGGVSSHVGLLRLGIWVYAIVVLIFSAVLKRFWCRIFCPTGSCLLLLSRHRKKDRILSGIEI